MAPCSTREAASAPGTAASQKVSSAADACPSPNSTQPARTGWVRVACRASREPENGSGEGSRLPRRCWWCANSSSGPGPLATEGSGASLLSEAASTRLPAQIYQFVGPPRSVRFTHIPVPLTRPDSTLVRAFGRSLSIDSKDVLDRPSRSSNSSSLGIRMASACDPPTLLG